MSVFGADLLAIDAGQSGVRLRWAEASVDVPAPPTHADRVQGLVAALESGVRLLGPQVRPASVCAGLTGFLDEADFAALAAAVVALTGASTVRLAPDSRTAHLGALGGSRGVVTASGTGAVTLAWDGTSAARMFDGLGAELGDHGGGTDLGRRGLRAAARAVALDGPSTVLADVLVRDWGSPDALAAALHSRCGDAAKRARDYLPAFTRSMAEAGAAGDRVAVRLWHEAARRAARTTVLACQTMDGDALPVSGTGGLFSAGQLFWTPWATWVHDRCPRARVAEPLGTPLDGAAALACLTDEQRSALGVHTRLGAENGAGSTSKAHP